ncbi:glutathione S-transferase family protein [Roseibium aggregatum]|uniref:glutathione S-transferase family protein n=1 Tax=Roseibium aggregatum TaxID=187304 RepID=UPI001AD919CD|nr:glutathione S-transferase family protein [Roseibium aggregatum]
MTDKLAASGSCTPDRTYRLHGSPDSANIVVRLLLEELELAYEDVPVDRRARAQNSEAYLRLNPQGLIPVLEVPGQDAPMFETGAILLYLADTCDRLAPARTAPDRGRFLKWLFFISNTLHSDLRIAFKPHKYLPAGEAQKLFSEMLVGRIAGSLSLLDREIAATEGPFLLGAELSCADLYLAACARWAQIYPEQGKWGLSGVPRLKQLLETLEERPAVRRACAMEGIEGRAFTEPKPVTLPGATA